MSDRPKYIVETKYLHIVKEPLIKNRTHQTYRWKQMFITEDLKIAENYIKSQSQPKNFRIVETVWR